ncbi:MAG: hypothetical protein J6M56_09035 [Clostridia bacterium]|nr:hypothetical protein [Clostridia bacterium]
MMNNRPQHSGHFGAAIRMPAASAVPDAEPVYRAGDTVMHPSEGVCTIAELRRTALSGMLERTYYVLKPATQKGSATVYMPVARGNTVLRPLLSEQDIRALIRRSDEYAGLWIADSKQRKEAFTHILSEGNYAKIIRMIAEIREQSAKRALEGKKPCAADEAILAEAERLLHQEFSYVLHMSPEETAAFVCRELGVQGN